MMLGNAVFRVCLFSFRARHNDAAWPSPAKRSNAAMDENGRAMDIAFPSIMGITSGHNDDNSSG
ncbi:MAG: hypothetical protein O7D86_14145 [Proteobacteria bacterium]|nr:hypothetical protein [Pseudomonadota bacterium]